MFCLTSHQSSMFEADKIFPDALPEEDWCFTFRDRIYPLINENKFKHLYSESEGRPNFSIKKMISLLIFMGTEKLTWRGIEFQFPRRLDWLIATSTEVGKAQIDHTTLYKFYELLETDNTAIELFTELTDKFIELCGTSLKKQRTDSFFIHGWLKLLSRYGLLTETVRKFLLTLRKQKPGLYEKIKGQLSNDYINKELEIGERDKKSAQRQISIVAKDLYRIKCAFENHKRIKHFQTFKILCTVFAEQCEIKEIRDKEEEPEIVIKDKPDTGSICSPHNTDVRCARKNNHLTTGDKAFVTETCDPENKTQFITDVNVITSTIHDSKQQPKIQERLVKNKFKPEKQYGDSGFVNGKTILDSREAGIELEGPCSGHSQTAEAYDPEKRRLDAGDFDITIFRQTKELIVTSCHNKVKPINQKLSTKRDKILVHFDPDICRSCLYLERCPIRIGKRVATFSVNHRDYAGAIRYHKYMENEQYRKECSIRTGIEATVSELTRSHGVRKSRHRKQTKTNLQLIFAAIACNVKRFIKHGKSYEYLEPEYT